VKRYALLVALLTVANAPSGAPQTPASSTEKILESVRRATGGDAWNQFIACKTEMRVTISGKTGPGISVENFSTGAFTMRAAIPELGVRQAYGVAADGIWRQDENGYISLLPSGQWATDELYLKRHAYWQANFGGATVRVLEPVTEKDGAFDRLEFRVPGGNGFTLWINRANHFIESIVAGSVTRYFSDYRRVDGLILPFTERGPSGEQEVVSTATKRTLLKIIDPADFAIPFQRDYDMPASGKVTVPADGGIIFQARINGEGPYTMFFDTGSPNVLSVGLAKELGLSPDNGQGQTWVMNGGTLNAQTAHVKTLQIGDLILHDQLFHIIEIPVANGNTPVAAIGYEVLQRLAMQVDYQHEQLTFYDAPTFHYSGNGTQVPMSADGISLEVQASIAGASGKFALDTGNEVGLLLYPGFVQHNHLIERFGAHFHGYSGKDYAGPNDEAYYARVRTVVIGGAEAHDLIAYLWTGSTTGAETIDGNIGRSVLRNFTATFDVMRGALYLEKNANWERPETFNRAGILTDSTDGGEKVMTVLPGSPAESAGIAVGDVITRIDGHAPGDERNDPAFLQPEGTLVNVTVKHGDTSRDVQLTLKELL
jgi:PDZ domain/Aspartyl protease